MRFTVMAALVLASAAFENSTAAEASGGAGGGDNGITIGRAKKPSTLPWPEPDAADVEKLETELRGQLPREEFSILRVGPWVIATDLTAAEARTFTESTIARYGAMIQRQLFTKTPRSEPVKVYLFKDHDSYTIYNKKLWNETPSTPYGYYSRTKRALVMNIGTGGGTLLHEMAHAMAESDFPEIPSWLNEGIGSLFEASGTNAKGRVIGVTNWRLTGLRKEVDAGTAPKFSDLVAMTTTDFYGKRSGANYAAARYLMQYLQEKGRLELFYTRIRDKQDASAAASLTRVFDDKKTIDEIEADCYAWVKTLVLR